MINSTVDIRDRIGQPLSFGSVVSFLYKGKIHVGIVVGGTSKTVAVMFLSGYETVVTHSNDYAHCYRRSILYAAPLNKEPRIALLPHTTRVRTNTMVKMGDLNDQMTNIFMRIWQYMESICMKEDGEINISHVSEFASHHLASKIRDDVSELVSYIDRFIKPEFAPDDPAIVDFDPVTGKLHSIHLWLK